MNTAIVGATGEVGRMMLRTLEEMRIPVTELTLLASKRSAGAALEWRGQSVKVRELTDESLHAGFDYVLFSAGGATAKRFAPVAAETGAVVIDNSSAFRRNESIPLVVPEINGEELRGYRGIVANPNCSTIQLVLALHPLRKFGLRQVVVSTYQSVSGAGRTGIEAWEVERNGDVVRSVFPRAIDANVIPQIGDILPDGWSEEENKMRYETKRILSQPQMNVSATTVRVPVRYGHAESVWAAFEKPLTRAALDEVWRSAPSVVYHGDDYITPAEIADSVSSHVCRPRIGDDGLSLTFWNVGHNVRLGAATNAVRILDWHWRSKTY